MELRFPLIHGSDGEFLTRTEIIPHFDGVYPRGPISYEVGGYVEVATLRRVDADVADDAVVASFDQIISEFRGASDLARENTTSSVDIAVIEQGGVRWLRNRW